MCLSLPKACELLSALYGETTYECADAHYHYGKALLEMARAEAGVFGNALDGGKLIKICNVLNAIFYHFLITCHYLRVIENGK